MTKVVISAEIHVERCVKIAPYLTNLKMMERNFIERRDTT